MKRTAAVALCFVLASGIAWSADIRLYTVNSKGQQGLVRFVTGTDKPGCHDLPIKRRIHRASQVGFDYCRLFSERDCNEEAVVSVRWKNKKPPTDRLTPGARWFLPGDRGTKVASWECRTKP